MVATMSLFFYLLYHQHYYITLVLLTALFIAEIYNLIYYIERTNRDLTNFLESIRFADFTRTFQMEGLGKTFENLKKAFNDVISDFQRIRSEKEEHFFYLQNIIQHISIGIIAYQKNGSIEMINNSAKKLFQIANIKNIKQLERWNKEMVETLMILKPGENRLIKVQDQDDIYQLAIYCTEFKLEDRDINLVSFKNIQSELEEQEMEAWQKLIRVLTHEIMNSIAPIASLTSTVNMMVKDVADTIEQKMPDEFDSETISDIQSALQTIHKRSTGLIHFVETYRNLTRIPKPNFEIFPIKQLFNTVKNLHADEIKQKNIHCMTSVDPEDLQLTADEQLIEQVLVNLIKNSIQALERTVDPIIELKAFLNKRGRTTIQVKDNGQGIIKDVVDKIFIPFFTTKSTGSGIGLSLSRQILRMHGGTINVQSEPDLETIFTLIF